MDLTELRAQQSELIRKQQELTAEQEKLALLIAEAERNQPFELRCVAIVGEKLKIHHGYRDDVVNIFRSVPHRWWDSPAKCDVVPLSSWPVAKEQLEQLENITITYEEGLELEIQKYLTRPDFIITLDSKARLNIEVLTGKAYIIQHISGANWSGSKLLIPILEGWRVEEKLKDCKVEWAEGVLDAIHKENERRIMLDQIALMEDAEVNVQFVNGFKLRPFQNVGVKFLDMTDGKAILADQMGLGKTAQAIAFAQLQQFKKILCVVPAKLKANWAREIKKLTGESAMFLSGSIPSEYQITMLLAKKPKWVIINYDIYGKKVETSDEDERGLKSNIEKRFPWIELLDLYKADLVIFDEAHYLKNSSSNRSQASRKGTYDRVLCLTGTPVLNRPGELWAMLTLIAPDKFPSEDSFLGSYTSDGIHARNVDELRQTLKALMIRRLKKDVVKELPPKNRITHYHELSEGSREIYKKVLEGIYTQIDLWNPDSPGQEKTVASILAEIMRCKQVAAIDKIEHTADLAMELEESSEEKNGHGKVIIFSQFKPVVYALQRKLGDAAVVITGDVSQDKRMEVVDKFQDDPNIRYLVATWQTAGEGLNLQAAGYVLFNDLFWTPAHHEQCEDRAYGRLADPHPIDAYYIVAEDTIEEWIEKLLAAKMAVIETVVEGMQVDRSQSVLKELMMKMKEGR